MAGLALLLRASANRVYGDAAAGLAAAELRVLGPHLPGLSVDAPVRTRLGGVDYLVFDAAGPLDARALAVLSQLSSLHALFDIGADGRLAPQLITPRAVLDEDIVSIQRYAGKTNEAFTHLLVNVALGATEGGFERLLGGERLGLLDPACGRGTALNRAALYGMDAYGIEIDERDVEAYVHFLGTWLKAKRLKHAIDRATLRKARESPAHRAVVTYGPGKDRSQHHRIEVVHDDTVRALDHLRARSIDLLVCDLPYGVHHGSRPSSGQLDRRPEALLAAALPVWAAVLRPGAGVALGWNRRTLARTRLVELVRQAGLIVPTPDDEGFVHQVDRSITRDVLVAARPA